MRSLTILCLFLSALPAGAGGDCASQSGNLLAKSNCGFDRDLFGWAAPVSGSAAHDARAGEPKPGALAGTGGQGSFQVAGPCAAARPGTAYSVGVRAQLAAGSVYVCGFAVWQYADALCDSGQEPFVATAEPLEKEWRSFTASGTTAAGAASLRVQLQCSGEAGFRVLFDDVVLAAP